MRSLCFQGFWSILSVFALRKQRTTETAAETLELSLIVCNSELNEIGAMLIYLCRWIDEQMPL